MNKNNEFGVRLRKIRKQNNLTQQELSKKAGISNPEISKYENGYYEPTVRTLNWLCQALNVKSVDLLGW